MESTVDDDAVAVFDAYRLQLSRLRRDVEGLSPAEVEKLGAPHLDGLTARELRRLVPSASRRRDGIYLTPARMADRLVRPYSEDLRKGRTFVDPCCGGGDLLLAAMRATVVAKVQPEAYPRILAREKHPVLSEVTRQRVRLQATVLGWPSAGLTAGIRTGDGRGWTPSNVEGPVILLNPPYALAEVSGKVAWTTGSASAAADFCLSAVTASDTRSSIAAILPDSLRSGERYAGWRREIGRHATVTDVDPVGAFDRHVATNVFILRAERPGRPGLRTGWGLTEPGPGGTRTLGDDWTVSVGDVVPHRHPDKGNRHPYIDSSDVPIGADVSLSETTRGWSGRLHAGPFVVVRRTSRTEGKVRLLSSVYASSLPTAVENHLIVIAPIAGDVEACRRLAAALGRPEVTSWVNRQSQMRHVPARLLRDLPASLLGEV